MGRQDFSKSLWLGSVQLMNPLVSMAMLDLFLAAQNLVYTSHSILIISSKAFRNTEVALLGHWLITASLPSTKLLLMEIYGNFVE
jgi:hypothetical protein